MFECKWEWKQEQEQKRQILAGSVEVEEGGCVGACINLSGDSACSCGRVVVGSDGLSPACVDNGELLK